MLHLDPDRLAALADDEPTPAEAAHLAACHECARERAVHGELRALAARALQTPLAQPLTEWSALSAQLADEGLLRSPGESHAPATRRSAWWMRAAAAVLLAVGGAAVGRATASYPPPVGSGAVASSDGGARRLTGVSNVSDAGQSILSVEDALLLMRRAEADYRLAAAYIAVHDTVGREDDGVSRYRARLAALDRVSDAALAAVNQAPSDPVVNQYLISARTARAVTLQQLNSSLPRGMTLTSY
jgi:hypothetical protein